MFRKLGEGSQENKDSIVKFSQLKSFLHSKFKRKWPDKNGFEECQLTI